MGDGEKLMRMYELLYERYGPQEWWPGESRCEIIVGAILTQNTNWANVEKAIANLKAAGALTTARLGEIEQDDLAELIRPAGYYNIKAKRLKNFFEWVFDEYQGRLDRLENLDAAGLREQLLAVNGIGPETADSIVLYAFDKPVFVVDAYTARVLGRGELIEEGADYQQIQDFFESALPAETKLFKEFHALLVRVGKEHCKPKPKCDGCPLEECCNAAGR